MHPIYAILMMAIAEGFIPSITAALIPTVIEEVVFGVAYGIITSADNVMNFSGDVIFGGLRNWTGSYDTGLFMLFGMSLFGLLLLILYEFRLALVVCFRSSWHSSSLSYNQI